uniref:Uncharacterized protein n=1 Tax=Cucumis melo TaxID=3656 RepID=A0A9I9E4I3_CUCME
MAAETVEPKARSLKRSKQILLVLPIGPTLTLPTNPLCFAFPLGNDFKNGDEFESLRILNCHHHRPIWGRAMEMRKGW